MSKQIISKRIIRWAAAAALLSTFGFAYTLQYSAFSDGTSAFLKWQPNAQITMVVSTSFPGPSAFNSPFLVQSIVQHEERVWNATLQAQGLGIRFVDGGTTSTISDVGCDGVNVITFTNNEPASQITNPGILAFAILHPAPSAGLVGCGTNADGTPKTFTATFAGQILDADITFNKTLAFSSNALLPTPLSNPNNDLEGTLLHEMGHVLGLHHSGQLTAVMVPSGQPYFPQRTLTSDDIAGINAIYGVNALGGAISGKITDQNGAAVSGAHVVLTNASTGITTVSAISDPKGQYSIVGFAPASYKMMVEPLNKNPVNVTFGNFPGLFTNPVINFNTNFVGTVTVAKGTTLTKDVSITTTSSAASITQMGVILFAGSFIGSELGYSVSAQRGNTVSICLYGSNLTGEITTSSPGLSATAATTATPNATLCPGAQFSRSFAVAKDAVPGNYDIYMGNASSAGALPVTTNPQIPAGGVVDGAAYTKTATSFASGGFISIFGSDFALGDNFVSDFPVPTQLGGVSVRVGDRFAPLFYAGAGQINAMIPYEVVGSADVQVIVGDDSVADYGKITVVSSAPRIFTASQDGKGPGAILNQDFSANSTSNPATVGSSIQIFCMGLGQTTPAAITAIAVPSSISGGAAQIAGNLTVTIGGKPATVQYKGIAPGFVGLYQVNAVVPAGLGTQAAAVVITDANGSASNPGATVTVAVK